MRDWGLVGKDHYPFLSDNNQTDQRSYANNGVSPANVAIRGNVNVTYPARLNIAAKSKNVLVLRANGDNTPPGQGFPAGIKKKFKIDSYKDTSSTGGRWLISPDSPQRVGSTIQTSYYFGPGIFEVGMKPLQDFGATTTIWAYHYNEFYPETPDPLQRYQQKNYNDPQFEKNCFITPNDTATSPGGNCSCPLNSFPAHPWQQKEMGEYDHWWAANSEIDIEFPTPASNTREGLEKGYANMMRFNTWKGQCGTQYTYSFQVVQTLDDSGNVVPVKEDPGMHDDLFHVWRFDWYNAPMPTYGKTRVEFYIDGVLQRNVSHNNPKDPEPRVRKSEWEFMELMPHRPMRLWIGVWFSYWGTASPAACLTPDSVTDPFSTTCAPWGDASDPTNADNPVWREALIDYVRITPKQEYGTALWEPELYAADALALTEYPYAMPYASVNSGMLPKQSDTGLQATFEKGTIDTMHWLVSQGNPSQREQTVWGQMCHGAECKGSMLNKKGTQVIQRTGGHSPFNVIPDPTNKQLHMRVLGDLYNGPLMGSNEIGGLRSDGKKLGASVRTAQYYGPGKYTIKMAVAEGPGVSHTIKLVSAAQWEETSPKYKAHCANAKYVRGDCAALCDLEKGWPKGTGFWVEYNTIKLELPFHTVNNNQTSGYSYDNVYAGTAIGMCDQSTGVGSNGTSIPQETPEWQNAINTNAISGNPFTNADGSRRFLTVELDWHTWKNASCPRHVTWSIDGKVVYETMCDSASQARIPVTAMRMWIDVDADQNSGNPYFESQDALLESVTITQYDEPTDRLIESFPWDDVAQPEQLVSVSTSSADAVAPVLLRGTSA